MTWCCLQCDSMSGIEKDHFWLSALHAFMSFPRLCSTSVVELRTRKRYFSRLQSQLCTKISPQISVIFATTLCPRHLPSAMSPVFLLEQSCGKKSAGTLQQELNDTKLPDLTTGAAGALLFQYPEDKPQVQLSAVKGLGDRRRDALLAHLRSWLAEQPPGPLLVGACEASCIAIWIQQGLLTM